MFKRLTSLAIVAVMAASALAGIGPAETVVLVNAKSPDSKRVAAHYVKARQIPATQVCEVSCDPALEISMDDFVRDVVDPLRRFLRARDLEKRCTAVVITQGMPILAKTPTGAVSTAAALSLLDTEMCGQPQIGPMLRNPYTSGPAPTAPINGDSRFLLVTALLSSTADEAIALIDRSVASDGTAPAGARFVFQDADGAAGVRNGGYDGARKDLEARGFETEHAIQESAKSPAVTGRKAVMGYMSGGSYSHLTVEGVKTNEYLPGAICDMLQSYGAVPQNFMPGQAGAQFPVTHMIRAGITGVHGAVAEPYNGAFPAVSLFAPYVEGFTLAETFHQRLPLSYWMNLTLGDPLCAPYAKRIVPAAAVARIGEDGRFAFDVKAAGAVRIDLYVDGKFAGSAAGESGTIRADRALFPESGPYEIFAEATGPGPAEPRGWSVSRADGTFKLEPAPASSVPPRITFDRFVTSSPATVAAGEQFDLKATAVDASGTSVTSWRGRVELRSVKPPVRWARIDSPAPEFSFGFRLTKVGEYEMTVTAPDDGREAKLKVRVTPGPFHHATSPASSFPLNQECDLDLRLEDAFGNVLETYDGTIALSVPGDAGATLPSPLAMKSGRGTLRNVLLTKAGDAKLVLTDKSGSVVSDAGEHVIVGKSAIRAWLVTGRAPAKLLSSGDPAASAKDDTSRVWNLPLRRRTGTEIVSLPEGDEKGGDAAVLVTWLDAKSTAKVRLLGAATGRIRVLLDGKEVFEGVPEATNAAVPRAALANLALSEGIHRLTIVAETRDRWIAVFEVDDGQGQFPANVIIRARRDAAPPK